MKHHYELIIAVALCALSITAQAEVVYEPLIVDSGFNRDVIAERTPLSLQVVKSYLLSDTNTYYWSMATQSVIRTINTNSGYFTGSYAWEIDSTAASGWPDDYRDTIRCIEDARNTYGDDLFFLMAPYDQKNVLTIRPKGGKTQAADSLPDGTSPGIQNGEGTLKFKKVGCYDRVFFLIAAAKEKGASNPRKVSTTVYYTDGDTTQAIFEFGGLSGKENHNVRKTNIYEGYYKKATHKDSGSKAYSMAFDMPVNSQKLISKIEFKNTLTGTGVMIFAVTGRTAAIDAPDEEATEVSNIDSTKFKACWEAVAEAASYRLDVATDIDFQNILKDYNNLPVNDSTCQDIIGLVSNNDYYWRVRSVNSEGGQSASSAPRRVKTAPNPEKGETPPIIGETDDNITAELEEYAGTRAVLPVYWINRTLYRDGYFNTICLPFSLDEAGIAASPLAGCSLYAFESADATGELDIVINPVTTIEAGVPYLIKWANTGDIIPKPLEFHNVNITTSTGLSVGEGDVQFVGHIEQAHIPCENHDNLFVGAENKLYWPDNTDSKMKGFRAYFAISHASSSPIRRGTPARLVERHNTPTEIESVQPSAISIQKLIRDGQMIIFRDGKYYNVLGGRIQ